MEMEWLLSTAEVKHWSTQVSAYWDTEVSAYRKSFSPKQVVSDLQQFLSEHNLYIGPATFTSGFISVVHEACRSDNIYFVKFVLKHHTGKFDINQLILYPFFPKRDETLVHAAVESSSTKILSLLMSHGASVNIPDSSSVTPLLRAVHKYSPNKDIVSYLIKVGADVHYQDNKGKSVLMYAVQNEPEQAVKNILSLLLKAGADPTMTDKRGYNVIHVAIGDSYDCVLSLNALLSAKLPPSLFPPTSNAVFFADQKFFILSKNFPKHDNNSKKITDVITKHPHCPPRLKVDSILVNATLSLYWNIYINLPPINSIRACYDLINEGLTLQAKLKLPPPIVSKPIADYGGLSEVISVDELSEKYSVLTNTTTQVNLAYQCLIIRERCLGYGDITVISSLFMYGGWLILLDHFTEGLCLWLRSTQMLLSHFKEGNKSEKVKVIYLIKIGYFCISQRMDSVLKVQKVFHDLSTKFERIICNLIECQRQSMKMLVNNKDLNLSNEHHRVSFDNWKNCLCLLDNLSKNTLHTIDVSSLCHEMIEKCSEFPIGPTLHINVLDIALSGYNGKPLIMSESFLSLLVQSGGDAFVNEIGWTGYRPLKLAQTKEATSLLLAHGAHLDAVSKPIFLDRTLSFDRYMCVSTNPHLDDYFPTVHSLTCLSARCIISQSIPYRSIDLPPRIVEFIALHDREDIKGIDMNGMRLLEIYGLLH